MVVHDINVTTSKLIEAAQEMKTINERLYDDLNEIELRLRQTESLWESEAGNEIRMAMSELKAKFFDSYKSIIHSYATFLEQAAETYEATENTIKSNASQFM